MPRFLFIIMLLAAGPGLIFWLVKADQPILLALSLLWVIALLWLSEALHITLTAFLVPILASSLGLLALPEAMKNFGHPIIFLFLGGFALAIAMREQGLDRWLADTILRQTGGKLSLAITFLAAAAAFMSMWISNTAVTAVMLPLILGLLSEKGDLSPRTKAYGLLVIAYSANIGGMGTLIGTAPNALTAAILDIRFIDWLKFGLPAVVMLWPLMMIITYLLIRPDFKDDLVDIKHHVFEWTTARIWLIVIFALTVTGWVFGYPLSTWLGIEANFDTWVAIVAMVLIGVTRVASWQQIEKQTQWGVLLLFGGGLTLSEVLQVTGASSFLGSALAQSLMGWPGFFILLMLIGFVIFLTEISTNTATTALLVPVMVALPLSMIDPIIAAIAITLAASCAFMLPVATPPNAMVYATGMVTQRRMMKTGIYLNILCMLLLACFFVLLL